MKLDPSLKVCGIYNIFNKVNGFSYIGSSKVIYLRIAHHFSSLRGNRHTNEHLQNAYNKYGEEAFEVRILEVCSLDKLHEREEYYISVTSDKYNFNEKPTGPLVLPTPDAERRETVRQKLTGMKRTEEQIERIRESHIGLKQSEESKQKKSEALKEYYNSEEGKKLQSEKGKVGVQRQLEKFYLEHPDGHRVEWVIKICVQCKQEFKLQPHLARVRQYCSMQCKADSQKGKIPWNKGLKVKSNAN
jgi:group I intron endonuclease